MRTKVIFAATIVVSASSIVFGCASSGSDDTELNAVAQQYGPAHIDCSKAEPKDILIAELVKHSVIANYPLTRLFVDTNGDIVGPNVPDLVGGSLELVNALPEARASVAQALVKVTGEPDYGTVSLGAGVPECDSVPTPWGSTTPTESNLVSGPGILDDSWKLAHKEFGKQCPLVKRHGNSDWVDPPGDGSTNLPPSDTVSATGVVADAWGLCPTGTPVTTHCKLSYATGINWTGRRCANYWGYLRCLPE
jgi:hypothetical protein